MSKHLAYYARKWFGEPPPVLLEPKLSVKFKVEVWIYNGLITLDSEIQIPYTVYHSVESDYVSKPHVMIGIADYYSDSESWPHTITTHATQHALQSDLLDACQHLGRNIGSKLGLSRLDARRKYYNGACAVVVSIFNSQTQCWSEGNRINHILYRDGVQPKDLLTILSEVQLWISEFPQNVTLIGTSLSPMA